ncbi:MAG: HAD hydrolase family protein [Bdellovibrio sp.]|nr:HAD hydrolase family protein [Bdellovibrio sp.]
MIPTAIAAPGKLLETHDLQERLKKIKVLILDVDGVMTDGRVFWLKDHGWTRHFHTKDGYGLKVLMKAGIEVAIISGGDSEDVRARMSFLKIKNVFLGDEDKVIALNKIIQSTGLSPENMAFMGDEIFDIPIIEKVGFSATVPHAVDAVKARVNYVTESHGGWGAVREVADAIRKAQGLGPYLT